ncbi:hypothetical protein ROZALSC1DRAFT_31650, partial [Rozella allomycis CSF55]
KIDAQKGPEKIADLLARLLEDRQVSERKPVEIDKIKQDIIKYVKKLKKLEKNQQTGTTLAQAQAYKDLIDEATKELKLQNEALKVQNEAQNKANMLRIKLITKMEKELEKETLDEKAFERWKEKIEFISRQPNEIYMFDHINEIKNEFNLIKEYFT